VGKADGGVGFVDAAGFGSRVFGEEMSDKTLEVPYLTQPTSNTCQSTCLKMFGMYLANRLSMSSPVQAMSILDIWKDVNEGNGRPSKERNSYSNMAWWLHKQFPTYKFAVDSTVSVDDAMLRIVRTIDRGFPVIVSTNHSHTAGHIILVIGYKGAEQFMCSNISFVCHDPYGKFNPSLHSHFFGRHRFDGGSSQLNGGELGPGKGVVYDYNGIRRIRTDKHSSGTYFLLSVSQ
jgi:hypothetical protein